MVMSRKIRDGIQKRKEGVSAEKELRDLLNQAASKSLKQFIQRLDAGEIPIDNVSDFIRILGAYKEINEIDTTLEGKEGKATLPELNMGQERALNETIEEGKAVMDDDGRIDVSDMTTEDVSEMIRKMDIAQNKANEEMF